MMAITIPIRTQTTMTTWAQNSTGRFCTGPL
jgi:hypothetical protein